MSNNWILEMVQFTDPYCTWCWGSEPVMRRIEEVYGDQIKLSFCMGGLVKDSLQFHDPLNQIGGPDMAEQVAKHWEEASQRHGMPVDAQVFIDMKDEFRSTWPASIAYKAAQMQDEEMANRFLRRLREAAAAEHKYIHRREVQLELAREVGLDHEKLIHDIDSGAAEKAFQADLQDCRGHEVTGFPSFRIRNRQDEEFMFFGFQPFQRFAELFERLAGDQLEARDVPAQDSSVIDFIRRRGKVAWREVGEVFGMNKSETLDLMGRLEGKGLIASQKAGNGWFYLPK